MENHTLEDFKNWHLIHDYSSNNTTVTLLGKDNNPIAEFNYPMFTEEDFHNFKNNISNGKRI